MNKSFIKGFVVGKAFTLIGLAAIALCVKINIVDPALRKEQFIEENRKRAPRKRIAP